MLAVVIVALCIVGCRRRDGGDPPGNAPTNDKERHAAEAASCVTSDRTPVAWAGGLACADATSCKSTCTTRLDCASTYMECNASSGTCEPDAVSVAASARGVQPSSWVPQVQRTPAQMAALLRGLGGEPDAQGRLLFEDLSYLESLR